MPRKTDHPGVTVSRNRHGNLYARWRDPDTQKWVSEAFSTHGFTTKTNAAKWLRKKSRDLMAARRRVSTEGARRNIEMAWPKIQEAYLEYFKAEHGEDAADRLERDWLRHWREFLETTSIRRGGDLRLAHLQDFRKHLASGKKKLKPATRNRCLGSVRAYLTWGIDGDYLRINTDHLRKHLKQFKVGRYQPRVLTKSELKKLLDAVVEHDTEPWTCKRGGRFKGKTAVAEDRKRFQPLGLFTALALLTGARPGEVLSIKWKDVDLEAGQIRVWGSKTRRERIIPLHDSPLLRELLANGKERAEGAVHVCGDWTGDKPVEIHNRQWRRLTKLAELERAPMKALRSTTIAHVASASTDSEYLLEARFGHGAGVSKRHYRQPLHGLKSRGDTIEAWLGVERELRRTLTRLGLISRPGTDSESGEHGEEED